MYKLGICFFVYNQYDFLKKNLDVITRYVGGDVQIVVSDNCSKDNIEQLCVSYNDNRIKYCKTSSNIGMDRNIINAIRQCDAEYAFIVRSKDFVRPNDIQRILTILKEYPFASYCMFTSENENGYFKDVQLNQIIKSGKSALTKAYAFRHHPSGHCFNRAFITDKDFDLCEKMVAKYPGVLDVAIPLLREIEAIKGDFISTSEVGWLYPDDTPVTNKADIPNTVSPFSPSITFKRFNCICDFSKEFLPKDYQLLYMKKTIKYYVQMATILFKYTNGNALFLDRYNSIQEKYNRLEICKNFYSVLRNQCNNYSLISKLSIYIYFFFCCSFMQVRWEASHVLGPLIKDKLFRYINTIKE